MDEQDMTPRLRIYLELERSWAWRRAFGDAAEAEAIAAGMDAVWRALDQAERLVLDARRAEMM